MFSVNVLLTVILYILYFNQLGEGKETTRDGITTKLPEIIQLKNTNEIENADKTINGPQERIIHFDEQNSHDIRAAIPTTCSENIVVQLDEKYSFKKDKSQKKCNVVFTAAAGVTLTFKCNKFAYVNCKKQFFGINIDGGKRKKYCNDSPAEMSGLQQIKLSYKITSKQNKFTCSVRGTSSPPVSSSDQICDAYDCSQISPISRGNFVIDGTEPNRGDIPYIVQLFIDNTYLCGGSIINKCYILTAAHCVDEDSEVEVYLGLHDSTKPNQDGVVLLNSEEIIKHGSYNSNTNRNDIALIKLDGEITYSEYIKAICIAEVHANQYVGYQGTVAGWGVTENDVTSDVLLYTSVTVTDENTCDAAYGGIDYNQQICAAEAGKDTCQGDSGGPMTVLVNGVPHLIGITSFGRGCAQKGFPGVYTRANYYLDWIKSNINGACC